MVRTLTICAVFLLVLVGCADAGRESSLSFENLPPAGNAERGERVYFESSARIATCDSCHNEDATGSPSLEGYGEIAGERVEGESALEYTFYAITAPGRYVLEDYGNAMPNTYDEELTARQIADLIAYLLSL